LTSEQKKAIRDFYAPYKKVSTVFHEYYYKRTGVFHIENLPDDLYINYIDKYYNNAKKAVVFENKSYFKKLFSDAKQPHMICCRINGFWYGSEYEMLGRDMPSDLLCHEREIVIKQAAGSSGGHAVYFVDGKEGLISEKAKECVERIKNDIIIQSVLVQHEAYSRLNKSSLNSLRLVSLLRKDGTAKIYSIILRMGAGNMRVDNESSGGINCGVCEDGQMRSIGYTKGGKTYTVHPDSGIEFASVKLPYIDAVIAKVKELHQKMPDCRLVSWDFTVDPDGEPVLIEANLNHGGLHINQINNGPLFGNDTKEILDEVFGV